MALLKIRVSDRFDRKLRDIILKSGVFENLKIVSSYPRRAKRVKKQAAMAIGAHRVKKDVFVCQDLINGRLVKALSKMSTTCSMKVLTELIRRIKSVLVDEIG